MDEILALIHELEGEQAKLERLIDESVRDGEYLMAHYHNGALLLVNRNLQTFRNLNDKNYDTKKMIARMVSGLESQLRQEYPVSIKDHFTREIERLKLELDELEKQKEISAQRSLILVDYLDLVVSHKLRGIRIVLKKSSNFALDVKSSRSGIKIVIKNVKSLRKDYLIHEDNIQHFYGLGFKLDKGDSILTMTLNRSKEQILAELQMVVSKIVFEIFYYKEFEGETFIEIDK